MAIPASMNSVASAKGPRSEGRRTVHLLVRGNYPEGGQSNVLILNISANGLLLETDVPLAVDEEICVMLPVAGKVPAQVVWTSGNLFGCQFRETVSTAVLSATQLQSSPHQERAAGERESIASDEPFHTRLVRLRKRAGISIVDMARMLGVNRLTVWNWERGKARPRPARLATLADVLGVSESVLLDGEEPAYEDGEAQTEMNVPSRLERNVFERVEGRFQQSVSQSARLSQLIAASKDQIAAIAGTTPDKIRIILEF